MADAFWILSMAKLWYLESPATFIEKFTSVPELESKVFIPMMKSFGCELDPNGVENVLRCELLTEFLD